MAQQEEVSRRCRTGIVAIAALLFLLTLAGSCGEEKEERGPLPGYPRARTVLPAENSASVYVLPDGQHIIYASPDGPRLLDVATGQDARIPGDVGWPTWLDEGVLYAPSGRVSPGSGKGYAITIHPLSTIELQPLSRDLASLPEYIREAESVYAFAEEVGAGEYTLLLLHRDAGGTCDHGYIILRVRNLDVLLAGIPYKVVYLHCCAPGRTRPPDQPQARTPSPDGKYYYVCPRRPALEVSTQEGELLNSVPVSHEVYCYGWAWDSSGVYFQEWDIPEGLGIGSPPSYWGPLQLLPVRP